MIGGRGEARIGVEIGDRRERIVAGERGHWKLQLGWWGKLALGEELLAGLVGSGMVHRGRMRGRECGGDGGSDDDDDGEGRERRWVED